jgi:hypothetical protein
MNLESQKVADLHHLHQSIATILEDVARCPKAYDLEYLLKQAYRYGRDSGIQYGVIKTLEKQGS